MASHNSVLLANLLQFRFFHYIDVYSKLPDELWNTDFRQQGTSSDSEDDSSKNDTDTSSEDEGSEDEGSEDEDSKSEDSDSEEADSEDGEGDSDDDEYDEEADDSMITDGDELNLTLTACNR